MFLNLILRNLKLYFRDRAAVFFSLLSVMIVVGIFALFLAQMQVDGIVALLGASYEDKVNYLVHSWILAGVLSMVTATAVFAGFGTMVNDKEKKMVMAFKSAPIKDWIYPFVNIAAAFLIGVMVSMIALIVYVLYMYFNLGVLLSLQTVWYAILMIVFSCLVHAFIGGLICSMLKTMSAFSAMSILIGTCIGFINGLYVPLGGLSTIVVNILSVFPSLHIATVFRKIIMDSAITETFMNAPSVALNEYLVNYGINLKFHEQVLSSMQSIGYACVMAIVCLIVMMFLVSKKNKEI